jgi:hypothetical protein
MSSAHDFDFLHGSWNVEHRKLYDRLTGCTDWTEFTGTMTCTPTPTGNGNVDLAQLDDPAGGYDAIAPRTFDPTDAIWSIWWLDLRHPRQLDPPVTGRFSDGIGTFQGHDTFRTQPIVVRFTWTDTYTSHPRWEQAFSPDDGTTWEPNWQMRFHRVGRQ